MRERKWPRQLNLNLNLIMNLYESMGAKDCRGGVQSIAGVGLQRIAGVPLQWLAVPNFAGVQRIAAP